MSFLLETTVRGTLVFLVVWALDRLLAGRMRAVGRAGWWLLVPLAFLLPNPLAFLPHAQQAADNFLDANWTPRAHAASAQPAFTFALHPSPLVPWLGLWSAGLAVQLALVAVRTRAASAKWSRARLCTDPELLGLLEDCKQAAGITAPMGLVLSEEISSPAILGWLRPRILLPARPLEALSLEQLRAVLFHELAHFGSLDIPLNWLFTVVRGVHWYNPLAHLAYRGWVRFREEAADEKALDWLHAPTGAAYGEALLCALQNAGHGAIPFQALAIGESLSHLKHRITMIKQYPHKSPRYLITGAVLLLLTAGFTLRPVLAEEAGDPKATAVAAMETWLHEIDAVKYPQSYTEAAPSFQKAVTSDGWVAALKSVRTPLGKCSKRTLVSATQQTDVPGPAGVTKGDFIIAQFDSSFANLAYAIETVTFEKTADGSWKASGYYIKPKS